MVVDGSGVKCRALVRTRRINRV